MPNPALPYKVKKLRKALLKDTGTGKLMSDKNTSTSDLEKIRRAALNWLTRRDYSQQEITLKLKSKGFSPEDIQAVVAGLVQATLINEPRFIENYICWRRRKGFGPLRIRMELQARGIAPDVIAERIQITDNAWFTEAHKVWQKHFKGKRPDDFKNRAQQMRFLQYRGYSREQIESVFGNDDN
jgi:regulatory protein